MAMLGEQFMVGEEICGAVISIRYQVRDLILFLSVKCLQRHNAWLNLPNYVTNFTDQLSYLGLSKSWNTDLNVFNRLPIVSFRMIFSPSGTEAMTQLSRHVSGTRYNGF